MKRWALLLCVSVSNDRLRLVEVLHLIEEFILRRPLKKVLDWVYVKRGSRTRKRRMNFGLEMLLFLVY